MNVLFSEILDNLYYQESSALLSCHDFCCPQCSSGRTRSMGKEWVYFFRLISLCLSDEKGGQILFLILCGLKSVQSILKWYSILIWHGPEQRSGTTVSSFKIHDAHFFAYTSLTSRAIRWTDIGHTWLCSLMLWCSTSSYLMHDVL